MKCPGIFLLFAPFVLISACTQFHVPPVRGATERALPPGNTVDLDIAIAPVEEGHPGKSAFRLVSDGYEAFALRTHSAFAAERSIDVQTYIWHADITGARLAYALLSAADRGVKVRILVDDMDARGKHYEFSGLSAHPNISVRFFNPLLSRSGTFSKFAEVIANFDVMNKRMHNKTWIVDNRVAFVGGRNIGDEYFGANDGVNFVDLGVAMIGPVVRQVSVSFDRYWNAPVSYPAEQLSTGDVNEKSLALVRDKLSRMLLSDGSSRYSNVVRDDPLVNRIVVGKWPLHWTYEYRFVSDDPLKAFASGPERRTSAVYARLLAEGRSAKKELWILSPYFVPGEGGVKVLEELARRGVDVRLITNSLASNDVVAVHSGYQRYRKQLLEGGIKLWELKPASASRPRASLFGSTGASLHAKALVIDGNYVFVGSYNLDPRSHALNTEQGVLVKSQPVGEQLKEIFMTQSNGEHAWQLALKDGELTWSDGKLEHRSEPGVGLGRRVIARVLGWLPLERQL